MSARRAIPTPDGLIHAYRTGFFPMVDPDTSRLGWYTSDPRAVIPLDERFHVPRSLGRVVRQERFDIRSDTAFVEVMRACADRPDGPSWIDDRLVQAYAALHALGRAHTVEAWRDGRLVGGLYGVHLGRAFFGESMFVRPDAGGTNASKVCLVHLVHRLRANGFRLLDSQFANDHIEQFGCIEIPLGTYLEELAGALASDAPW